MRFLSILLLSLSLKGAAAPTGCEVSPASQAVLTRLAVPDDIGQTAAQRSARKIAMLRAALSHAPRDTFLHEAYQDIVIGRIGDGRAAAMEEYRTLLARHPADPVFLYLAARAGYSWQTKQSLAELKQALAAAPDFAPAHLLLAQIYSAGALSNPQSEAEQVDRYNTLCPGSVQAFPYLKFSKNRELLVRTAARIRKALAGRSDSQAASAYPALWNLEEATVRSDQQATNRANVQKDVALLQAPAWPRSEPWFRAIGAAADTLDHPEWTEAARAEMAALYPHSSFPCEVASHRKDKKTVTEALAVARACPGVMWLAYSAFEDVVNDPSATETQIEESVQLLEAGFRSEPEGLLTLPPITIDAAAELAKRGADLAAIPQLVRDGFAITERTYTSHSKSDLLPDNQRGAAEQRDMWYLFGYFPLLEAQIKLQQTGNSKDTLLQAEEILQRWRPGEGASSESKMRYADFESWLWYLKGLYAAADHRKPDALIAYRNALTTFPPRRPRPDRRDEVMQTAQQLWKEMGGTPEGWNDWARGSSLRNFYAGSGGPNAWARLATEKPNLRLTDSRGRQWLPQELARKTSFVTLWASWCTPCRAELPYVEKLSERFANRPNIAILALNVDDNPHAMTAALGELKLNLPSIAARDFAYDMLPTMAIPAAWLMTPAKTEMFVTDNESEDKWLEDATAAVNQAAGKK